MTPQTIPTRPCAPSGVARLNYLADLIAGLVDEVERFVADGPEQRVGGLGVLLAHVHLLDVAADGVGSTDALELVDRLWMVG